MSKEMAVVVLGLVVVVTPYLGFPSGWRELLLLVAGLAIMLIGFLLRGESLSRRSRPSERVPFAENERAPLDTPQE